MMTILEKVLKPLSRIPWWSLTLIPFFFFILFSLKEPIFTNDSFQYLKMAFLFQAGHLPLTDKWMPFYSILIGIIHLITSLSLIKSAVFVHSIVFLSLIIVLHFIAKNIAEHSFFVYLLVLLSIGIQTQLLINSVTIMAELTLLFFTLLFLYQLNKTIATQKWTINNYILLIFIVLCSVFTKYNGLILFIMLLLGILLFNNKPNRYISIIMVSISILVPYGIWSRLKSKDDVIINAIAKNSFIDNILINSKDTFKAFIDFFLNDTIYSKIDKIIPGALQITLLTLFFITLLLHSIKEYQKKKIGLVLVAFFFLYTLSLIFLLSTAGVNEVNTRTLLYPLIVFLIYLLTLTTKENNTFIRFAAISIISIIGLFNFSKLIHTTNKQYTIGSGTLNKDFCINKDQSLDYAKKYITQHELNSLQIHTNENKLLPIYFNYEIMQPLPTNTTWTGNYEQKKNEEKIDTEISQLSHKVQTENNIICILGNKHNLLYEQYYSKHFTDTNSYNVHEFDDGVIITPKINQ